MISVKFRKLAHTDSVLKKAPGVFRKHISGGLSAVGKRLKVSAQSRMRRATGQAERSLTVKVNVSGTQMNVLVFSTLVQAFVDAYGLRRGVFPDFGINSRLYKWVKLKAQQHTDEGLELKQSDKKVKLFGGRRRYKREVRKVKKIRQIPQPSLTRSNANQRTRAKNKTIRRLTFLVARSIFRAGIRKSSWNKKALEANRNMIIREMQNAMTRTVNELNRG